MRSSEWNETAVIIAWDDSDGWYDHQMGTIVIQIECAGRSVAGTGQLWLAKGERREWRHAKWPLRLWPAVANCWWFRLGLSRTSSTIRLTDQSSYSTLHRGQLGTSARIGSGSTDAIAGTLNNMFDFSQGPRAAQSSFSIPPQEQSYLNNAAARQQEPLCSLRKQSPGSLDSCTNVRAFRFLTL